MGKKSIPALLIAILIPLIGYFTLKSAGEDATILPKRYFFDSVITEEKDGKIITDTIWHKTANIQLVNQLGDTVSLYDIKNKAIVINIFFTSCGSICPQLTKSMAKLQQSFLKGGNTRIKIDTSVVQFISLSIDPERDSVTVLKHYADSYGVNPDNWWMLTGNRDSIYNFIFQELKIDKLEKVPISPEFPHTGRFVLLDKDYVVRGRVEQAYSGILKDSASMSVLARDIGLLILEKDKTKKSKIFTQIIDLSWLWLVIALLVSGFIWGFNQRRKKEK
ncbi:MAG TPA: SCO family protein [Chitinophagaceae bacterium]|nr:SCO family protein [Chitinophagaceae bacterium]MCC6635675.1 SCO family protein [Chitinophagaceae bacterium]HMZ45445.1 SCO family protein [Chitinophagaceae bacterium]HNE94199.1 SCO family protein [Chitinophagaceae bacterium]HNJ58197.1 SCO family protein [Chitinophagaceae bacterium]